MLKKLLKTFSVIIILLSVIPVAYYFIIKAEAKNKIDKLLLANKKTSINFSLEADSVVYKRDLEDFILLSNSDASELELSRLGSKFLIQKDIELQGRLVSSCEEINCLYFETSFSKLSSLLWKGLMGIEDYRFFDHEGVDYKSILRAILVDIKAMKIVQGGSTLTQQLVKNLFLSSQKKLSRKLKELIYASYIEDRFSKDEIILLYFNTVFWGSFQGLKIKGIEAASYAYFAKSAKDLSSFESIILIGMLKGPYYYSPRTHLDRLKERIEVVFARLEKLKLIGNRDKWSDKKWASWHRDFLKRNDGTSFRSFAKIRGKSFLSSYEEYTLMQSVQRMKSLMKNSFKGRDIGIKILASELSRGGDNYSYYSKNERNLRVAIEDERHQVASILKPIMYDFFFLQGKSPKELVSTEKLTLNLKSGAWTPSDSSHSSDQFITIENALRKSKNIPLIRLSAEVGFEKVEKFLSSKLPRLKTPLSEYPAQLLGALELSLSEVTQTYRNFVQKRCFSKSEIMSTIKILSDAKDTTLARMASDTFKRIKVFGKTGTSNKAMDNWFVGFDSKELFVIWTGQETDRDGDRLISAGATSSFRVYQDYILHRGKRINELLCK